MSTADIEHALQFAVEMHAGQVDKAGRPYILHPLRVMMAQEDDTHRIVAILHDVAEDCNVGFDTIAMLCDTAAFEAILAITKIDGEPYHAYIRRVKANPIARKVKIADIRDNMDPSRGVPVNPKYAEALAALESE